jgi:hypothetical protein
MPSFVLVAGNEPNDNKMFDVSIQRERGEDDRKSASS